MTEREGHSSITRSWSGGTGDPNSRLEKRDLTQVRHGIGKGALKKLLGTGSFEIDTRVQVLSKLREHLMKSRSL